MSAIGTEITKIDGKYENSVDCKIEKNKNEESQKIKLDRDVTATNSRPILGCGAKLVT